MQRQDVTPAALDQRFREGTYVTTDAYRSRLSSICLDTWPIDPACFPDTVAITTVSRRKPADPAKAPDIWTGKGSHHIVSEKARAFISTQDPEYSTFLPVKLIHGKSGMRFGDKTYFYWVIRRFIKCDTKQPALPQDWNVMPDLASPWAFAPMGAISQVFHALAQDEAAQSFLETIPFWTIWPWNNLYFSAQAYRDALDAGLTGLNQSTETTLRHVTRYLLP